MHGMSINDILDRNFTKITSDYRVFAQEKDTCRKCPIYDHYKQVGQSEGNAEDPTFMFIGGALGEDEVKEVRPFTGSAGQRLRSELRVHSDVFSRDSVLISNVLSCRPLNNKFPIKNDRKYVERCCSNWVKTEIKMLKPKVIITLGNPALMYIRGDWGVTANRGQWKFLPQYQAWSMATFHPSYIIRCSNSDEKAHIVDQFESDIKRIATTWHDIVDGDYRMSLSKKDWAEHQAVTKASAMGLIGNG